MKKRFSSLFLLLQGFQTTLLLLLALFFCSTKTTLLLLLALFSFKFQCSRFCMLLLLLCSSASTKTSRSRCDKGVTFSGLRLSFSGHRSCRSLVAARSLVAGRRSPFSVLHSPLCFLFW